MITDEDPHKRDGSRAERTDGETMGVDDMPSVTVVYENISEGERRARLAAVWRIRSALAPCEDDVPAAPDGEPAAQAS